MQGIDYESPFYLYSEDNNENLNDFPGIEPNSPNPYTQNEDNMFSRQMMKMLILKDLIFKKLQNLLN